MPRERADRDRSPWTSRRPSRRAAAGLVAVVLPVAGCAGPSPEQDAEGAAASAGDSASTTTTGASPTTGPATGDGAVLVLDLPATAPGRCRPPSASVLRRQDVALRGTVSEVGEQAVRLDVGDWYRGGPGDTVRVGAVPEALRGLLLAPDLRVGSTYLLSATDGEIVLCGSSGPATPALARLYHRAFGAPE